MDASEMRQDIVDRGIERAESEMRPVLQHLADARFNMAQGEEPQEHTGIRRRDEKVREKEVDPEAVEESFKEAEVDPTTERDPGEGKPAA